LQLVFLHHLNCGNAPPEYGAKNCFPFLLLSYSAQIASIPVSKIENLRILLFSSFRIQFM